MKIGGDLGFKLNKSTLLETCIEFEKFEFALIAV